MPKQQSQTDETSRQKAVRALHILDTPIEERFERITRAARQLTGLPIASLSLVDGDRLWFKSIQGLDAIETGREGSLCAEALTSDGVFVVPDTRKDPRFAEHPMVRDEPWVRFYAGHAVHSADGVPVGTLCVADRKPRKFGARQQTVLQSLARAADAELQARRAGEIQRELASGLGHDRRSAVDSLTRLWGREAILGILEREFQRARKKGTGIGTIIVDLDPLQPPGENRGFEASDAVIRRTARRLVRTLRPQDSVGRFGGGEFLGVVTTADRAELAAIAQKMRAKIARLPMPAPGGAVDVTASLGAAWAPANGLRTPGALLDAANYALCNARLRGGNRVEVRAA